VLARRRETPDGTLLVVVEKEAGNKVTLFGQVDLYKL